MKRMTCCFLVAACLSWPVGTVRAEDAPPATTLTAQETPGVSESLRREANAALARGLDWLLAHQAPEGHWSNPDYPALTAFPVWALARAGRAGEPAVRRAVAYLRGCAREDGGIYVPPTPEKKSGGLSNYNTAIGMVALHLVGDPELAPLVLRARRFVARSQHLGGDMYHGGMGYDAASGRAYADLSNSYLAYEAMRMTQSAEERRPAGEAPADLDWKAAQRFLENTQNDPAVNPQSWATPDPRERGGFAYHPQQTRAGTFTDPQGVVKFRSMRGMTYAGLLSYIYADVSRTDPRVEATVNWIVRNWSLDANNNAAGPGGDPSDKTLTQDDREGLFYLYNVMAKGLAVYGQDVFAPPDGGRPFNWRTRLIERLLALQRIAPESGHGYWVNDVGRYWESDPVLVTCYALIALQAALPPAATE